MPLERGPHVGGPGLDPACDLAPLHMVPTGSVYDWLDAVGQVEDLVLGHRAASAAVRAARI
jgi:hypothetical protein